MLARRGAAPLSEARAEAGRHARLGLSVRASGDRWYAMVADQSDQGRHRPGFPRFNLGMTLAEIAQRDDGVAT